MTINTSNEVSPTLPAPSPPTTAGRRRILGLPITAAALLACTVAFVALHPLDATLNDSLDGLKLSGDIRREWQALQQFGQGVSICIIALVVYLLDRAPARRRRLIDFGLALAAVGIVVTAMKWLIGRPRPKFGDPHTFLFPWGTYPVKGPDGSTINAHAWDLTAPSHAQLWSMPSSHTAFAVVTALFLALMYPRLKWLAVGLALIVAAGRLVFDAHWLTDVTTGATVALAVAWPLLTRRT